MNEDILTSYNYKNLTNAEVQFNVVNNGTTKYYTKILTTTIDKNINETNKIFAFKIFNVYSLNSDNVTALDLFCRFSYGTTKTLKSNCEIISDIAHKGRYYEELELYTFVTELSNEYKIDVFLYSNENYYRYYVCPYFLLNDKDIEAFYKGGEIYSVNEFNTIKNSITEEISWKKTRKVNYGFLKIMGNLDVNGNTTIETIKCKTITPKDSNSDIGSNTDKFRNGYLSGDLLCSNLKSSKFVVGGNGITPKDNTTEYPDKNIKWSTEKAYLIGDSLSPKVSETYNLGSTENRWNKIEVKEVKSDKISIKSSDGTYYFLGVNDDGTLFTYK